MSCDIIFRRSGGANYPTGATAAAAAAAVTAASAEEGEEEDGTCNSFNIVLKAGHVYHEGLAAVAATVRARRDQILRFILISYVLVHWGEADKKED